jgi:hypothetical protein
MITTIDLDAIDVVAGLTPDGLALAAEYAARPTPLPPIRVTRDGARLVVSDGAHRYRAAIMRGDSTIAAEVT